MRAGPPPPRRPPPYRPPHYTAFRIALAAVVVVVFVAAWPWVSDPVTVSAVFDFLGIDFLVVELRGLR